MEMFTDHYRNQLETLERMRLAQADILGEINTELSGLSKEERGLLEESTVYRDAKNIYEAGLLNYVTSKFTQEYISSQAGKEAARNLLETIKSSKEKIAYQAKIRDEKINKILEMLENDPEMKKRYEEYGK